MERRKVLRYAYADVLDENGGHVSLERIESETEKIMEDDPAEAERFYGNRLVSAKGAYVDPHVWDMADASGRVVADGVAVCGGFDGSDLDDWTAIRLKTVDGFGFTPTYGPDCRPCIWDPREFGGEIPRGEVAAAWAEICSRYRVLRVYCDPFDWRSEIAEWALEYGESVFIEWSTGRIIQMSEALKRFLRDLKSGVATHDGCVVTGRHALAARKSARGNSNYVLVKSSAKQKIDAVMSEVLAHEAWSDAVVAGDFEKLGKRVGRGKILCL